MKFRTEGLIIREQNIGEQDKLVSVLTKSHGVVKAFVRGAKNIKSGKGAATALFSRGQTVSASSQKYCARHIFLTSPRSLGKMRRARASLIE